MGDSRRRRWVSRLLVMALAAALSAVPAAPGRAGPTGALVEGKIRVDGLERSYLVYQPSSYDPARPAPLVLAFHGAGGSGRVMAGISHLTSAAEQHGFIAVFPDGTPQTRLNGGLGWTLARGGPVDDVTFAEQLIDRIAGEHRIDGARIYAAGYSNGGFLAYRLACDLSARIAAIGLVAGSMGASPSCGPGDPVSVLHIHGMADPVVPYAAAPVAIELWRQRDGCPGPADLDLVEIGPSRVYTTIFRGCRSATEVALVSVEGAGHEWPGGNVDPYGEAPPEAFMGTALIAQFLMSHPKPGG